MSQNLGVLRDKLAKPDFVYTHTQAVEEGAFINVSEKFPRSCCGWFKYPVFVTDTVWNKIGELVKKRPWTSYEGYVNDMIMAARMCKKHDITPQMISFEMLLDEKETELWAAIDANDNGDPVVTIFFPSDY